MSRGPAKNRNYKRMKFPAIVRSIRDGEIELRFREDLKWTYSTDIVRGRVNVGDEVFYILYGKTNPGEYWGRIVPLKRKKRIAKL